MESFQNYKKTLDTLNRIRELSGGELDLPQLCVVGDQSSGKSSLLKALTEVDFPAKAKLCTRVPIVVTTKHSDENKFEIFSNSKSCYVDVPSENVKKAIENEQMQIMNDAGKCKVKNEEIRVKVCGPNHVDIIVVDLPGIIHNGDETNDVRTMIDRYVSKEQTLVLLVSEAKQDEELTYALEVIRKHDPDGTRTVRCLSKFDTFDSDDTRAAAVRLVLEGVEKELGPHAVICNSGGGDGYLQEDEMDEMQESFKTQEELDSGRVGVHTLKARLPDLFAKLVNCNLPKLREQAAAKKQDASKRLRRIGENEVDSKQMIQECQRVLLHSRNSLEPKLTIPFEKFKDDVHKSLECITEGWVGERTPANSFKSPFFYGESTYDACLEAVADIWTGLADRLFKSVALVLETAVAPVSEEATGVSKSLEQAVVCKFATKREEMLLDLKTAVKASIGKANSFGTANHYLYDKYVEHTVMPDDLVDRIASTCSDMLRNNVGYNDKERITKMLKETRERMIGEHARLSVHEHAVKRLTRALEATCAVEKKSVTDAVLKDLRDVVVDSFVHWVRTGLLVDVDIASAAVEDEDVQESRHSLKKTICSMESVIAEIDELKPPAKMKPVEF